MTYSPILTRALRYGGILTLVIAVVGSIIGWLVAGQPGLVSALIGAGITAIFMAFTAVSIMIASKVARTEESVMLFFGIILGSWLLKFVVFIFLMVILRDQPFIDPIIMFVSILAAVIGSLVVDVLAYVRSRVPYVDVELPGE